MTLTLEGGLPEVSRKALLLFGERVGPSPGGVLLDWDEDVSNEAIKGGDERTRIPPVFFCGMIFLFVLECGSLEVAFVSDAAPVVVATATLAERLVEAGL